MALAKGRINVRKARPDEAAALTDLCIRSKQSNGYDDAFMAACRDELTISENRLQGGEFWVAVDDGDRGDGGLCGCACLDVDVDGTADSPEGEVHAFFIDPDRKRQGVGRLLWQKLLERAEANGLSKLYLDADPFAVPFYEALGFIETGDAASGSITGRRIPHMIYSIASYPTASI